LSVLKAAVLMVELPHGYTRDLRQLTRRLLQVIGSATQTTRSLPQII